MPRVQLSDEDREEYEEIRAEREVIADFRRMLGRELGDRHLRERGILPPE